MAKVPSERLDEIYTIIREFILASHYSPTVREIGELAGIPSTSHVNYYLNKLVADGRIRRERGMARCIQLA